MDPSFAMMRKLAAPISSFFSSVFTHPFTFLFILGRKRVFRFYAAMFSANLLFFFAHFLLPLFLAGIFSALIFFFQRDLCGTSLPLSSDIL